MAPLADALARLHRRWATWWPGADVAAMDADVRERLAAATAAWDLRELAPFGRGEVALVSAATRAGEPVVLKAHPRGHGEERFLAAEVEALAFWAPSGAVPCVLGVRDDGLTFLMERVLPGEELDDAGLPWDERLTELGRLVARLHAAGSPPESLPHITDYAGGWATAPGHEQLLAPAGTDVLVHADLHGGNALRAGAGWKAIDPHAVRADRHADVWALIDPLAPEVRDARQARAWVERYARAAGLDPERAAAFVRLRARHEASTIEAHPAPPAEDVAWSRRLRRMAGALEE